MIDEIAQIGLPLFVKTYFPVATVGVVLSFYGFSLERITRRPYIKSIKDNNDYLENILDKLG